MTLKLLKTRDMKKLLIALTSLIFIFQSCYEDYKFDYDYTSTYFSYQYPLRSLIVEDGKDLTFDFGVVLGGVRSNNKDEIVNYAIDPSLLVDYPDLKLLPEDHYSLSDNSKITIHAGEETGRVTVTLDKEWFLNQEDAINPVYALPLQITNSSTDSIVTGKDFSIIVLRYYNEYQGLYWLNGQDATYNFVGDAIQEIATYRNDDAVIRGYKKLMLTTKGKSILNAAYTGKESVGNYSMNLDIRKEDGLVTITPDASSVIKELTGTGYYDKTDKTLYLDYIYYKDDVKHAVADTLYYLDTPMSLEQWN